MNLVIRPADPEDYDRFIGNLDAWWDGRAMAAMLPRLFFTHFRPWTNVAECDGELAGFLSAFQSQTDPGVVYCHFIGVNPGFRRQGVGEALYQRLFADATERGCREILAVTSPANIASLRFHLRLGFETMAGPENASGVPFTRAHDGPAQDRVRLRRPLRTPKAGSAAAGD